MVVLAADKKVRGIKLTRPTRDGDSLKHKVWIKINKQTIFESSRLGLVAIHGQVASTAIDGRQETPLQTSWKSGAAAPANHRVLDHIDHIRWQHIQGFFKRFVAARGYGLLPRNGASGLGVGPWSRWNSLGENGFFKGHIYFACWFMNR